MNEAEETEMVMAKKAVMTYVEGVVEFDFEKGESPWHPGGVKIAYNTDKKSLDMKTIQETKPELNQTQIEQIKKEISQQGRIISVDVTGNAAAIKLKWDFQRGGDRREITDYILLLKIDEEWKIVAKVFNENVYQ